MREPTRAPMYAAIYHGLCQTARELGYALAIHGSVTADLDLVAVPWIDNAADPDVLAEALREHIGACFSIAKAQHPELPDRPEADWEAKPHGRIACNLYLGFGSKVDLSVTPRLSQGVASDAA